MSLKIDVSSLVKQHYQTLRHDGTGKITKADIFSFFLLPFVLSILVMLTKIKLSGEFIDAIINFGAIFSALLMSVLVLVYDQDLKLEEKKELNTDASLDNMFAVRSELLSQLYHNICFAIVSSLLVVVLSLLHIVFDSLNVFSANVWVVSPLIIFVLANMVLTTIMIVKRMHSLLDTKIYKATK